MLLECIMESIHKTLSTDTYCSKHYFILKFDVAIMIATNAIIYNNQTKHKRWTTHIRYLNTGLSESEELIPDYNCATVLIESTQDGLIMVTDTIVDQDDHPTALYNISDPAFTIEPVIQNAMLRASYLKSSGSVDIRMYD